MSDAKQKKLKIRVAVTRIIDRVSSRTLGMSFDELMAFGTGVISEMPGSNSVHLTFDDGPSTYGTGRILEILEKHRAQACFFMIGHNVRRHPAVARAVATAGHEVGCHSDSHPDFHWLPPWRIVRELRASKEAIENAIGRPVISLRAPFGHLRWDVRPIARQLGFCRIVGWNVAPAWNETCPQRIVESVIGGAKPGSIVLLHDAVGLRQTDSHRSIAAIVEAMDPLLTALNARGWMLRPVCEQAPRDPGAAENPQTLPSRDKQTALLPGHEIR